MLSPTIPPSTTLMKAERWAADIIYKLQPFCTCVEVAGSVRRKCTHVHDLEIMCLPNVVECTDLFGNVTGWLRVAGFHEAVDSLGVKLKGNIVNGRYIQLMLEDNFNLDLFVPDEKDYYRQLCIRTGSADFVRERIAYRWKVKGWCGSDKGFRRTKDCIQSFDGGGKAKWICVNDKGELPPVWESEEEFFEWMHLPYVVPELRK